MINFLGVAGALAVTYFLEGTRPKLSRLKRAEREKTLARVAAAIEEAKEKFAFPRMSREEILVCLTSQASQYEALAVANSTSTQLRDRLLDLAMKWRIHDDTARTIVFLDSRDRQILMDDRVHDDRPGPGTIVRLREKAGDSRSAALAAREALKALAADIEALGFRLNPEHRAYVDGLG